MSKKKLLEESTIRSFMKLANLQPLADKFLKEAEEPEEAKAEEDEEEDQEADKKKKKSEKAEKDEEGKVEEARYVSDREDDPNAAGRLEEVAEEDEAKMEEGKESEGRPASKKEAPKGTSLAGKAPAKMAAAKNAAGDAKLKPAQKSSHHSDKPDSIEAKQHSNAQKKNNGEFEIVSESLEEEMHDGAMEEADMEAPEAGAEMGSAGESGEHQDKMKELIRGMLNTLKDMGAEYGMSMEISDEGAAGGEEMAPPSPEAEAPPPPEAGKEDEAMMEEKLDEMVEKLTKRVAARLVKEAKKKH